MILVSQGNVSKKGGKQPGISRGFPGAASVTSKVAAVPILSSGGSKRMSLLVRVIGDMSNLKELTASGGIYGLTYCGGFRSEGEDSSVVGEKCTTERATGPCSSQETRRGQKGKIRWRIGNPCQAFGAWKGTSIAVGLVTWSFACPAIHHTFALFHPSLQFSTIISKYSKGNA